MLIVIMPSGGTMGMRIIDEAKTFIADKRMILYPADAYDLIFTIKYIISLAIYQWHLGAGNPKPVAG